MRFTEKRKRRLKYTIFSFVIICMTPILERGRVINGASSANTFAGEELTCVIDLGNDMYDRHGLKTGFNYDLLEQFAKDNRCSINILLSDKNADYKDSLKSGAIDILITPFNDSTIRDIANARAIDKHSIWAVNRQDVRKARGIDTWISHAKGSDMLEDVQAKYFRMMDPHKRAENGVVSTFISPYDHLFKKYSRELGWDWRLLAAVVYQESRFSIGTVSPRGAVGLMQVKPQTAGTYGISDLVNPEKNLEAGVRHLKRLQKMMRKSGLEGEELIKFTLAAYNAGEGRIADCRRFAESNNSDSGKWSEIVALIPMMREDSILENKDVRLGKFQGYETISYVENIMALYNSICTITAS